MYLAINYQHQGKMPADMTPEESREWWNRFNGGFTNQALDTAEFITAIQSGYAYTTQHSRYRKADNFICGQHVALDLDTEDERSTFDYLMQDSFIADNATFLHTTPSHTAEKPRCRVVFVLDRPIRSAEKYTLLAEALVYRFGLADRKCKDAARLFFGSEGCQVRELGSVLTLETAAAELVEPYKKYLAEREAEHKRRLETMQVVSANDVPEKILEAHARTLLDRVQNAPNGEKYGNLRDIARTFGGYIGGGYYGRLDVEQWLQAAIAANPNDVKDLQQAYRTISQGLDYGQSDPLYFEMRKPEQPEQPARLDAVKPPLTEEQRAQVESIIADIAETEYWRGYHDGMTREQRESWHKLGFTDWAIDRYGLGYAGVNKSTGEIVNALTVPFHGPDGSIVNIEYRPEGGGISYEYELVPPLFFTDSQTAVSVLVDDSLTAMTTYFNYGHAQFNNEQLSIIGLPELGITPESLEVLKDTNIIIVVSPDFDPAGRGLKYVKNRARFLRLPQSVNAMVRYGFTAENFSWLLRQAKVLA